MANEIFVDTSGFYALLVSDDRSHRAASKVLATCRRDRRGFVTTDYVLDETATLLKARGHSHLAAKFLETTLASRACQVCWMDPSLFEQVRDFFVRHSDKDWSFTDCVSFRIMKERKLRSALTRDHHFTQAGFEKLLD